MTVQVCDGKMKDYLIFHVQLMQRYKTLQRQTSQANIWLMFFIEMRQIKVNIHQTEYTRIFEIYINVMSDKNED